MLEVPASKAATLKLLEELIDNHSTETFHTERVVLNFGKCQLLCRDKKERDEFRNQVTVIEALRVLKVAYHGCESV